MFQWQVTGRSQKGKITFLLGFATAEEYDNDWSTAKARRGRPAKVQIRRWDITKDGWTEYIEMTAAEFKTASGADLIALSA